MVEILSELLCSVGKIENSKDEEKKVRKNER